MKTNLNLFTDKPNPYEIKNYLDRTRWIMARHEEAVNDRVILLKLYRFYWGEVFTLESSIQRTRRHLIKIKEFKKSPQSEYETKQYEKFYSLLFAHTTSTRQTHTKSINT